MTSKLSAVLVSLVALFACAFVAAAATATPAAHPDRVQVRHF
ncbi:MAG: hypothetical protein QOI78_131 [Actinomycetota bacterium]|jgi:hypothetical protein|nr:hypothetical protein [Actinomycetota bacterium]